jgi:hypothetical protein
MKIRFLLLVLILAACHRVHAAEPALPEWAPITESCYYDVRWSPRGVSYKCEAYRTEAEDYIAKRHWACVSTIYVIWQGHTETVRCRSLTGGVADYVSMSDGNLYFLRAH